MSRVIKSADVAELAAVRPVTMSTSVQPAVVSSRDDERDFLRRRIAALEGDVRLRDATIQELRDARAQAFTDGEVEGIAAGLQQASDRQVERLALLDAAIRDSQSILSNGVAGLDRLAAELARDCLDKIFADPDHQAARVTEILAAQLCSIEKSMLVRIEVSRVDFPDDEALAALAAKHELFRTTVTATTALPTGGCVLTLRLGQMEIGLDRQWASLRDVLDAIGTGEA